MNTPDPLADVFPDTQDALLPRWWVHRTGYAPRLVPAPEDRRWEPLDEGDQAGVTS